MILNAIRKRTFLLLGATGLLLAACAPNAVRNEPASIPAQEADRPSISEEAPVQDETSQQQPEPPAAREDPFEGVRIRFNPSYWPETDFSRHSVDYSEILSGGPPPDGIPAIDSPVFESVDAADGWLGDDWPVMFFEWNGDARAYPLAILIHHEIVNDVVGDRPVTLTFCPLCNSTIAFDRTLPDGRVLDFGTTGNLRNSDLVMYDRLTKSWWQQFTGEAIVGELTGTQLAFLPSQIIAWSDFKAHHPDGKVLSRETGFGRPYGLNPYPGYDSINNSPFLFDGETDGRLPAVERVVAIEVAGVDVAYPFSALSEVQVVNDVVSDLPLVVFWKAGTTSTFGASDLDTGSTGVFSREVDGEVLSFLAVEGGFEDEQTGSRWNLLGEAVDGPLAGRQLERIVSGEHFWFAWAVFKPETTVWSAAG